MARYDGGRLRVVGGPLPVPRGRPGVVAGLGGDEAQVAGAERHREGDAGLPPQRPRRVEPRDCLDSIPLPQAEIPRWTTEMAST